MVEKLVFLEYDVGPLQCPEMEAQSRVPQQTSTVGHTDGEMGGRRQRLDTTHDANTTSQGRRHQEPARVDETTGGQEKGSPKDPCRQRNQGICLPLTLEHQYPESHRHTGDLGRQYNDCGLGARSRQDENEG